MAIDKEFEIYTILKTSLQKINPKIHTSTTTENIKAEFPFVGLEEIGRLTNLGSKTLQNSENHSTHSFEINVMVRNEKNNKLECKVIANIVHDIMLKMGFSQMSSTPLSLKNGHQIIARYNIFLSK